MARHCPSCGAWNSFTEEVIARENASPVTALTGNRPRSKPQRVREIEQSEQRRFDLSSTEVNRVLGGGLIRGSMILLGGEPGIGKSTLSLQIALRANGLKTLYVSGEESPQQIKMRAERLGVGNDECYIYSETNMENILRQIDEQAPDLVVIDSIQTIYTDTIDSSPGSVSQIRECAALLQKYAKQTDTSVVVIGPYHQGRRDRRAEDSGAHRGRRAPVRRPTTTMRTACCAAQEPLRRDVRDRRIRNAGRRAGRSE